MSHWSSANTTNRTRLARALSTHTGVGYQKCLHVISGLADAGLLPAFSAEGTDGTVRAIAPLVLLQAPTDAKGRAAKGAAKSGRAKQGRAKVSWGGKAPGNAFSDGGALAHFSPHDAIAWNRPPGVAIVGDPGSGKHFFGFSMVYEMVAAGVRTVYLDAKADALPLARMPGLSGSKVVHVTQRESGMLNPFTLGDDVGQSALLALETVRLLMGGRVSGGREEALIVALNAVSVEANPSLGRVVDVLLADEQSAEARSLGLSLDVVRKLPHARLCFGEGTGAPVDLADGLTVITMVGFDLPGDLSPADYSYENRLGVATMYLLARHVRGLLLADRTEGRARQSAVVIDEAQCLTTTASGTGMVAEFGRVSRSTSTALVLVTQDASSLLSMAVRNAISTVFSFRSSNPHQVESALDLLGLDAHEGHRHAMADLRNGECLWREADGQVVRAQVEPAFSRDDIAVAFSGNP